MENHIASQNILQSATQNMVRRSFLFHCDWRMVVLRGTDRLTTINSAGQKLLDADAKISAARFPKLYEEI